MKIELQFTPWSPFRARTNELAIRSWLQKVGEASKTAFKTGAGRQWGGGKGSSAGEWPMRRSGRLIGTIGSELTDRSVTVGSGAIRTSGKGAPFDYSSWLRDTGRKMSKEALEEGMRSSQLGRWVEWSRM